MTDHVSAQTRSEIMRSVGTQDTGPELQLRRLLHREGFRYSLRRNDPPGRPDIVFASRVKVIFVHGCFWHGHQCRWGRLPKTRKSYWAAKQGQNVARDARVTRTLRALGWGVATVWQCELRHPKRLLARVSRFLVS